MQAPLVEFAELNPGFFLKRYKRFFVDVTREDGNIETVHCANTGSMKSCLLDNCPVYTSLSSNPDRKLKSSLELMQLEDGFACLNTAHANRFIDNIFLHYYRNKSFDFHFLGSQTFAEDFSRFSTHKREAKLNAETRFDFLLDSCETGEQCWLEVKSVSLRIGECLAFPDAVTERGQKHLHELMQLRRAGKDAFLFFVLMRGAAVDAQVLAESFRGAHEFDPQYVALLDEAVAAGVQVRVVVPSIQTTGFGLRGYFKFTQSNTKEKL